MRALASGFCSLLLLSLAVTTPVTAEPTAVPTDLRASWRTVVDTAEAESVTLEAQRVALEAETGALDQERDGLLKQAAEQTFLAWVAGLVFDAIPLGKYLVFPPLLLLALLLALRPASVLRYFDLSDIPTAFKLPLGQRVTSKGLRIALLAVVLIALLTNAGLALADEAPPAGTYRTGASELVQYLKGDPQTRLRLQVERLLEVPNGRIRVDGRNGVPATFPAPGSVQSGSFYHHVLLAAFHIDAGDVAGGRAFLAQALDNLPSKSREFRSWLIELIRYVYSLTTPLDETARLKELALSQLSDVMSLVELGKVVEAKDAAFAAQLLELANKKAREPSELLLVFHYRKAGGLIEDPDKEWAELVEKVQTTTNAEALLKVFLAARYLKIDDMATSAIDRLAALKLSHRERMSFGTELVLAGHAVEGERLLRLVVEQASQSTSLHELISFASERSMVPLRDAAFARSLELVRSFEDGGRLLGLAKREQLPLREPFLKALANANRLDQVNGLITFAEENSLKDLEDLARAESVGLMRSFGDMVEALKSALDAQSMDVAVRIAQKINEQYERKSVPLELFPKTDLIIPFYKGKVQFGLVVAALYYTTGRAPEALAAIEHLVSRNFVGLLLGMEDMRDRWDAMLFINALDIYQQILEKAKHDEARRAVNDVESWVLQQSGLELPLPEGAEERVAQATARRDGLKQQVEALTERKAHLVAGIEAAKQAVSEAKTRMVAYAAYTITATLLLLLALWIAIIGGLQAAAAVVRFRTFAFFARVFEIIGWLACTTLVLAPLGLIWVVGGQAMGLFCNTAYNAAPPTAKPQAPTLD